MYYPFVRKALFQLDPERAHEFTFQQLRRITGTPLAALVRQNVPEKPVQCMGLTFKNPLGLAAGLDKMVSALMPWARWALAPSKSVPSRRVRSQVMISRVCSAWSKPKG